MTIPYVGLALLLLVALITAASGRNNLIKLPTENDGESSEGDSVGTRWAVLVAGSNGYWNYRHQADVCHAYQILKKGGLRDENIIVFMYDDIANNLDNPRPGVIINNPRGEDVYKGVPKDYVGRQVTANNLYAVLLGDKAGLTGGSGKVIESGPNDHIFIYYTDHGGPGILGMPWGSYIYADELNDVLKKMHDTGSYKSLVFYLEACESGSIFEGILPENLNIYATTASNAEESSWGTYCPGEYPSPPAEYDTCLGDLYSVAWMEDSDIHNLRTETLGQQYHVVKRRTANDDLYYGSHVMEYGDRKLNIADLFIYMGTDPKNDNYTFVEDSSLPTSKPVNQRDADLLHFWHKFRNAPEGSTKKFEALKQLAEATSHRAHVDTSVQQIGNLLFGNMNGAEAFKSMRRTGQQVVDDWNCLRSLVRTFEMHCGSLSQYGMKHMRSFANICNAGVNQEKMAKATKEVCTSFPTNPWSSIGNGFSA